MLDPFVYVDLGIRILCLSDDDLAYSCIEDNSLTHHTVARSCDDLTRLGVRAAHIHSSTYHLLAGSGYDRILLGMHRAAQLISLTARDVQLVSHAEHKIGAVLSVSGCTVIACGDDSVVFNYYRSVALAQTSASLGHRLCYIKIIIML